MSYGDDDQNQQLTFEEVQEVAEQLSEPEKFRLAELIFDGLPKSEQIRIARMCRHKLAAAATLDETSYIYLAPLIEKLAAVEPQ